MSSAHPSGKWTGVGLSDIGLVRRLNQDAFTLDNTIQLWTLADGMGGHAGGEVASQLAVETIPHVVRTSLLSDSFQHMQGEEIASFLHLAIEEANQAIRTEAEKNLRLQGMGTTIVVVAIITTPTGYEAIIGHAGDSRAYLLRQGTLSLWTKDHSLVEERLALNLIMPEQVRTHPLRHVITKALGIDPHVHPTIQRYALEPFDLILLCSDGLTKMLTDQEIERVVTQESKDPESICRRLVSTANSLGGEDNTTVVVIGCDSDAPRKPG